MVHTKTDPGFTLVELLIVIVVIAVLAAISFVSYGTIQKRATNAQVMAYMKQASTKLQMFHAEHGRYPTGSDELTSVIKPQQGGSYKTHSNAFTYCYNTTTNIAAIGAVSSTGDGFVASGGNVKIVPGWEWGLVENICQNNIGVEMASSQTKVWAWIYPGSNPPSWSF